MVFAMCTGSGEYAIDRRRLLYRTHEGVLQAFFRWAHEHQVAVESLAIEVKPHFNRDDSFMDVRWLPWHIACDVDIDRDQFC